MISTSVLTIVKGRHIALNNLLMGLQQSSVMPTEMIVVFMNEPLRKLAAMPFPVKCYTISSDESLPLAAARNLAAEKAEAELLIFLDVDCIPGRELISIYLNHYQKCALSGATRMLMSGQIRYLEQEAVEQHNFLQHLDVLSNPDPIRKDITDLPYHFFWSLNFACAKDCYQHIGGFDISFKGYGAEDTDFAFMARELNVPLHNIGAIAYHQYHDSYNPPLNHFTDIVQNAQMFEQKWGQWPMQGWLKAFEELGLISWNNEVLEVKRLPTDLEIQRAIKKEA